MHLILWDNESFTNNAAYKERSVFVCKHAKLKLVTTAARQAGISYTLSRMRRCTDIIQNAENYYTGRGSDSSRLLEHHTMPAELTVRWHSNSLRAE